MRVTGNKTVQINTTSNSDTLTALQVGGSVALLGAGSKLSIAAGTNASIGTATLSSGTVTVNTTAVTSNSHIHVFYKSGQSPSTTTSILIVTNIVDKTSFTVTAYTAGTTTVNTLDANQIEYDLIN
jgi:hypothetical protein